MDTIAPVKTYKEYIINMDVLLERRLSPEIYIWVTQRMEQFMFLANYDNIITNEEDLNTCYNVDMLSF